MTSRAGETRSGGSDLVHVGESGGGGHGSPRVRPDPGHGGTLMMANGRGRRRVINGAAWSHVLGIWESGRCVSLFAFRPCQKENLIPNFPNSKIDCKSEIKFDRIKVSNSWLSPFYFNKIGVWLSGVLLALLCIWDQVPGLTSIRARKTRTSLCFDQGLCTR